MKNPYRLALTLTLAALAGGCLENEEDIEIRPDGSVRLAVAASGDVADLAEGYPVPLDAGWQIDSPDAERWVERFGPSTGGLEVRTRLDEMGWDSEEKDGDAELRVVRELASVDAMPRWYAPPTDPYQQAYLERGASLEILKRGDRTVYVFERTYHGRFGDRFDPLKRMQAELEETLSEEDFAGVEESDDLSPELWNEIAKILHGTYRDMAGLYARTAVEGLYTRGDASLPPHRLPALYERVVSAVAAVTSRERIDKIYDLYLEDDDLAGAELEVMAEEARQALRDSLTAGLASEGMNRETINAVLFALESTFTTVDHSGDLGDEEFTVRVTMPGQLVSGNYDSADGSTATWNFEGGSIGENGRVLRLVSVLE